MTVQKIIGSIAEMKDGRKGKTHRLVIQVGIIMILIFVATLVFTVFADYVITRDAYLSSKNEMIDRDLNNVSMTFRNIRILPWGLKYMREHPGEASAPRDGKDPVISDSTEFEEIWISCLSGAQDPEALDPDVQSEVASRLYGNIAVQLKNTGLLNYSGIYLLGIVDESRSCIYSDSYSYTDIDICGKSIEYPASEHSAVEKILSEGESAPEKTLYEIYYDNNDDKHYYIGYYPICFTGEERCVLTLRFDWSEFQKDLIAKVRRSMLFGLLFLIAINGLLMLFLYRKAIAPVLRVKKGVQDYMNDKDSHAVSEKMDNIHVKNEIGVLADSFSDLAMEIDRYTKEVLTLNSEKERISTELALATNIQSSMLPSKFPAFPDRKEFDIYASMDPAKEVGGDFYDFFMIDDDHLCLIIADVSGKGVPAALFMMASKIVLENQAMQGKTPAQILKDANSSICSYNKEDMFVTVWLGILELSTGKLTASNAGHEKPAILSDSGQFKLYNDKHCFVVGGMNGITYKEYELTLKPGDKIFVYTDGVPEATNAETEMFGTDRMITALNKKPDASPQELLSIVRESVDDFVKEAEQFDDLTMLSLEYFGPEQV